MADVTGFVLRLRKGRMGVLKQNLDLQDFFAEPVEEFKHSRNVPLICFILDDGGRLAFVAKGRRGVAAGTGLRRLNLRDIHELSEPVQLESYARLVPPRFRTLLARRVASGGLLTPKQFRALVDAIVSRDGELGALLRRYSSQREERIQALSQEAREQLGFQQEAVATAMFVTGLDRTALQEWDPPSVDAPTSFLQGLPEAYVREDAVVANDLAQVPGFDLIQTHITGSAVFQREDGTTLTVVIANRQRLEELTGADLVYYNERFKAFVMVQYKMMEDREGGEAIFRLPNAQLDKEIGRMEEVLRVIEPKATVVDVGGFRLFWNPFYLKFCPRVVFSPDNVALSPGMYIPVTKYKLLASSQETVGPRGGRGITFRNVARRLDNTSFATLLGNAWIGTTPSQSKALRMAIRNTIRSGKAVVLGMRSEDVSDDDEYPIAVSLDGTDDL